MTAPAGPADIPLPVFERPAGTSHPVLAAVLAELREREESAEPPAAYYADSPDPAPPGPPPPGPTGGRAVTGGAP
ncbi:hypothetical protein [Streptomyces sp. NPDC002328]|uniref:hypothetical protein n=1 Tax=Streptomyces sp. NPDC002328 TaxID=3364642 RepID=UPI0036A60315